MLHNYKSYTLILESKTREKKIEKVREKIKKFTNIPDIYNWSIEKCISDRSTEGIQYAVWVANQLKIELKAQIEMFYKSQSKDITDEDVNNAVKGNKESQDKIIRETESTNMYGTKQSFDKIIKGAIDRINEEINFILDWLKSPMRTEKVNLSELTFEQAKKKSEEWHDSLSATGKINDETGKVFIEFDDGFYWIDLQTTFSKSEAEAMGHCGNTNEGDTLFSLRDVNKSPHVTVAYDSKDGCIYQMKGRNNYKPIDKYHPYIYRLLVDPSIKPKYFGYEYNKKEDFNLSDFDKETFDKVFKYNPNLIYDSINYDYKMCKGLIQKNYLNKEEIKEIIKSKKDVSINIVMDFLNDGPFSKEELKDILKSINYTPKHWGDLANIKLYEAGLITLKQLSEKFDEITIVDGVGYIDATEDNLSPFLGDSVKSILFDDDPFGGWNYDWYDMERSEQVWDDLTKENKEKVIEKILEYGESLIYKYYRTDESQWFFDLKPTKDMFKWIDNPNGKGDYFFLYSGNTYQIDILIDENNKKGGYHYCDLEDLYTSLNRALLSAQQQADENEYYKIAKKEVVNLLGNYERVTISKTSKPGGARIEAFRFKLDDLFDWTDVVVELEGYYTSHSYGSDIVWDDTGDDLWTILERITNDTASINDDRNVYGNIDPEVLNDLVSSEMHDL